MSYNIINDPPVEPTKTIEQFYSQVKENNLGIVHDQSQMNLATPDDSVMVVGPPRLSGDADEFYIVGLMNSLNYSETANLQPMKAIGSKRHIMSRTNGPVQGSIARMIALGANLYRALYAVTNLDPARKAANTKFAKNNSETEAWFANLEEDLFRIPFGLGVIYMAPSTSAAGGSTAIGADYIEAVTIQNRNVSTQSGQTFIMEQVSFIADRVVPFDTYVSGVEFDASNPAGDLLA